MLVASRLHLKELTDNNAILLGPWCIPLPSDSLDPVQYSILDCPWKTAYERLEACEEINIIYEKVLFILSDALNDFHNEQKSVRFWRILIGPLLYWLVNITYDKYFRLLNAKKENDVPLLGLSDNCFITPKDTNDFAIHINHDDSYNLQLTTMIAGLIDFPVTIKPSGSRKILNPSDILFQENRKTNINVKIYNLLQKIFYSYADTVLYNSYHSSRFINQLFLKSKGKIVEFTDKTFQKISVSKNVKSRTNFNEKIRTMTSRQPLSEITNIILQLASDHIPICFLEGFYDLKSNSRNKFRDKVPKRITSAVGWFGDEEFKIWAADCASKGTKLFGLQHGGNYGILSYLFNEKHEREISDKYVTWGWLDSADLKVISAPAQKLLDIVQYTPGNSTKILYIGTAGTRFLLQFPEIPENFSKYHENQVGFISSLSDNLIQKLRIRLHAEDKIWEIGKRLTNRFKDLQFETWDVSLRESLSIAKIVVCDQLSTTFLEALASNVPTILFWDPTTILVRPEAESFFEDFRKVGILHDTPESAAAWLEKVYPDVSSWWNSKECQNAVANFCQNYARTSKTPIRDWLRILKNINEKS